MRFLFVLILSFVMCLVAIGAQVQQTPVVDFSIGLVTSLNSKQKNISMADVALNVDLSVDGSARQRKGYIRAVTIAEADSILHNGLFGAFYSGGDRQLFVMADSVDVGWAVLKVSGLNSIGFGTTDEHRSFIDTVLTKSNQDLLGQPNTEWTIQFFGADVNPAITVKKTLDTNTIFSDVIDSLVDTINGHASLSPVVTASNVNDTLVVLEDAINLDITVFPNNAGQGQYLGDWIKPIEVITTANGVDVIANRLPATGTPVWTQFNDNVYLTTGVSNAYVFTNSSVREFPTPSPGNPTLLPLTDAGTLKGRYYYVFQWTGDTLQGTDTVINSEVSSLVGPIIADSQEVSINKFPPPTVDSLYKRDSDTVTVRIWRTIGTLKKIDGATKLYLVDSIAVDSSDYATAEFTDTTSDVTLITKDSIDYINKDFFPFEFLNGDSAQADSITITRKPGAPGWFSSDSTSNSIAADSGIWTGTGENLQIAAGWSWMCTFIDTLTGTPSDTGRSFNILQRSIVSGGYESDSTWGITRRQTEAMSLVMPRHPSLDSSMKVMLYRAAIVPKQFDTSSSVSDFWINIPGTREDVGPKRVDIFTPFSFSDSFLVDLYFLVGEFYPGDTMTDSIHFVDLLGNIPYVRNAIPTLPKGVTSFDDRLFMWDDRTIFYSAQQDTILTFSLLSQTTINRDDGDVIQSVFPQKSVVKVQKTNKTYFATKVEDKYVIQELSANYGGVSPWSQARAPEGDFFLSRDGVRLEIDGKFREQSVESGRMSTQLDNFDDISLQDLRESYAAYIDDKYILSLTAGADTQFVLNKIRGLNGAFRYGWTQWTGLNFVGWTEYAVGDPGFPGDTGYFVKAGSSEIFRYGVGNRDDGAVIPFTWISGPANIINGTVYTPIDIAYHTETTDSIDSTYTIGIVTPNTVAPAGGVDFNPRLDTLFYSSHEYPAIAPELYWRIAIQTNPTAFSNFRFATDSAISFTGLRLNFVESGRKTYTD